MKNLLKKYKHSEEGFTLIELIIVIAILAIIAAIAIPNIIGAVDDSRKTTDIANAKIIASAMAQAKAQNDGYASVTLTKVALSEGKTTGTDKEKYMASIYEALNSVVLKPKFDTVKHTNFYLSVDNNTITVYSGTGVAADAIVYPTPSSEYAK